MIFVQEKETLHAYPIRLIRVGSLRPAQVWILFRAFEPKTNRAKSQIMLKQLCTCIKCSEQTEY